MAVVSDYEILVDSDENDDEDGKPFSLTGIEYFPDIELRTIKPMSQIIIEAANCSFLDGHHNAGRMDVEMFSEFLKPLWNEPVVKSASRPE